MSTKSFEEFYYIKDESIHSVDDVITCFKLHGRKIDKYREKMFCPECHQAMLSFIPETSIRCAHLRRYGTAIHKENCSYNYKYARKKVIKEYFESISYNAIQDKLDSAINMLCRPMTNQERTKEISLSQPENNPMLIPEKVKENTILRSLRRKSLNVWAGNLEKDELYIFYGKVKLRVVEHEKRNSLGKLYNFYTLELYRQNKNGDWTFRTSLYQGGNRDCINEDFIYYIALIGSIGDKGWDIKLINKDAVKYCICE
ncbi:MULTISPECIES: hypothetical protein [unclassified Clostridioides]|uniref:hypothetical protein n=1 Tax=unclassified Clostridioides TaxID=2635829 RepID=UPI0038B1351D